MGLFGRGEAEIPYHPREEPRIDLPLSVESMETVFRDCVDFSTQTVRVAGDEKRQLTLCYISGMVRLARVNDYVLRPLAQDGRLADCPDMGALMRAMENRGCSSYTRWRCPVSYTHLTLPTILLV